MQNYGRNANWNSWRILLPANLLLESSCCKKLQKRRKSSNQETVLGNRGFLKVLNDTKLVLSEHEWPLNHLGSIRYNLKPSDVPYFQNQFLGWDFFWHFQQQDGSSKVKIQPKKLKETKNKIRQSEREGANKPSSMFVNFSVQNFVRGAESSRNLKEFLKNSAAFGSSDKILTREVDRNGFRFHKEIKYVLGMLSLQK